MIKMERETRRVEIQAHLDGQKAAQERNKLGQFATPTDLAREIVAYGLSLLPMKESVRFLDPAFGTGSFFSALQHVNRRHEIQSATAFEIDSHYAEPAIQLWKRDDINIRVGDFTANTPKGTSFNLVICNPPYVRHHHIEKEQKLRLVIQSAKAGVPLSGLAGLYCHFIVAAHKWMVPDAVAGWLIPSEFMDVNYGRALKDYLLEQVTLLRIHRFDPNDLQFSDALVSSAVVWIKNSPPPFGHKVEFSYGGTHERPALTRQVSMETLKHELKWTRFPLLPERTAENSSVLADFFEIKRGLATGDNTFFLLNASKANDLEIPKEFLQPVLPSPRYLKESIIEGDGEKDPVLPEFRYLLNCRLPESEVELKYPKLWNYLSAGKNTLSNRYLCRKRKIWYLQEQRSPSLFVCTYMGRGSVADDRPVRFILNESRAIVTNSYLMLYPRNEILATISKKPGIARDLWSALNQISSDSLKENGRVYGGGLHKMEPSELGRLPAASIEALLRGSGGLPATLFDTQ